MPRSSLLSLADFRELNRLVEECRDRGDDPHIWRQHLIAHLGRLTGAGQVTIFELNPSTGGWAGATHWGWEPSGIGYSAWNRTAEAIQQGALSINRLTQRYRETCASQEGSELTNSDLGPGENQRRSDYSQELQHPTGGDAQMSCLQSIPNSCDSVSGLVLVRPDGLPDFTNRQRDLVQETNALIAPLIGSALARYGEPSPGGLPPRTRQVLRCLLEGDCDKRIAVRLAIHPQTVNAYTKAIYRHFGVSSRAELLARWISRRWSNRCAWDESR